ncbi:hypothetical protein [Polynucleobacter sp. MWH-Aus1W21]|uniref:hypothetical protein n=1 Tax=Polynucleobacter sp. MWH-Aus1W21 TaxID=1855880 RepID=UPI001BFE5333|nr:hypothetical protein [Polynucleobacter sp. MWH-Aus1W21]QWD65732.1 hypothetical protein ICW03_08730 [Polynucleobacter sp. MWH-Aus1W21]
MKTSPVLISPFCNFLRAACRLLGAVLIVGASPAKAAIIGQMPSFSDILYITGEPCTSETGKVEPNWYFSYSVNALGTVTRSCYVRYNDQIWIRGPYGSESTFPMSYFSKPAASGSADASPEVKQ